MNRTTASIEAPTSNETPTYLNPRLHKVGYGMAHLVNTNLIVVADSMGRRSRPGFPVYDVFDAANILDLYERHLTDTPAPSSQRTYRGQQIDRGTVAPPPAAIDATVKIDFASRIQ